MPENVETAARSYFDRRLAVVPVKQKKPLVKWALWQERPQTEDEFKALPWSTADGFAVVCGTKLDNDLYFGAVDFDVKNVSARLEKSLGRGSPTVSLCLCICPPRCQSHESIHF